MKAVVGSMTQSKRIELSEAASVFSRFAATAGGGGARHATAAYLRRTSSAFDELVWLQTEIGLRGKGKGKGKEKKRGKSSIDGRRGGEEESEIGAVEAGDDWTGEIVDSNVKRQRVEVQDTSLAVRCDIILLG